LCHLIILIDDIYGYIHVYADIVDIRKNIKNTMASPQHNKEYLSKEKFKVLTTELEELKNLSSQKL
jgi:hypothetical protein